MRFLARLRAVALAWSAIAGGLAPTGLSAAQPDATIGTGNSHRQAIHNTAPEADPRSRIAAICDAAARTAAARHGVPLDVLRAVALTETGRPIDGRLRPWPWAVNFAGTGRWFDDPDTARAHVAQAAANGTRNMDLGCFQINVRWHGQAFPSIDAMFDPDLNADYAARFLAGLHDEFGDWSRAAGAYHSRTPSLARRYRARFDRILARLGPAPDPVVEPAPVRTASGTAAPTTPSPPPPLREELRQNTFPLLVAAGATLSPGSLFRDTGSAPRPVLDLR